MIKVHFSDKPIEAKPIHKNWGHLVKTRSHGKSHHRLYLAGKDNKTLAIRLISKDLLDTPPRFDFLHWIGIRKRIVLHVQAEKTEHEKLVKKMGYVVVNSESLRKRLGIKKSTFYQEIKKDEKYVQDFIQKAIDKECAGSLDKLGRDYLIGRNGKERNLEKAFELFKRAANGDWPDAFGNLAYCYSHGIGVPKNSNEAIKALESRLKDVHPKEKLGLLSMFAGSRIREIEFLTDDPKILTELGIALLNGNKDFASEEKKAFELFQKAAKQNYLKAFEQLILCYSQGKGVEKNSNEALNHINLLVEAAKKTHKNDLLAFNKAVGKSFLNLDTKAHEVTLFCEANPEYYIHISKELFRIAGLENKQLKREAFNMLQKAAAHNLPEAHAYIANCYYCGSGVEKSSIHALETLEKIKQAAQSEEETYRALNLFMHPG